MSSLSLFYLLCTYTLYVSLQFLALYFLFFGVDWFLLFCIVRYYEGLQKCFGLYSENAQFSADEIDRLEALYKSLAQQQKWSSAVKVAYFIDFFFPSSLFRMKTLWLARFAVLFTLFLVLFFHCYAENSYPLSFKTIYILLTLECIAISVYSGGCTSSLKVAWISLYCLNNDGGCFDFCRFKFWRRLNTHTFVFLYLCIILNMIDALKDFMFSIPFLSATTISWFCFFITIVIVCF